MAWYQGQINHLWLYGLHMPGPNGKRLDIEGIWAVPTFQLTKWPGERVSSPSRVWSRSLAKNGFGKILARKLTIRILVIFKDTTIMQMAYQPSTVNYFLTCYVLLSAKPEDLYFIIIHNICAVLPVSWGSIA